MLLRTILGSNYYWETYVYIYPVRDTIVAYITQLLTIQLPKSKKPEKKKKLVKKTDAYLLLGYTIHIFIDVTISNQELTSKT